MNRQRILTLAPLAALTVLATTWALHPGSPVSAQESHRSDAPSTPPGDPSLSANVVAEPSPARIQPSVSLDRSRIAAHAETEIFVLVNFTVPQAVRVERDRPPLDLGLVIDRSGSMSEAAKITHAREAAFRLVDAMASSDVLGVVEYDDAVTVLWPSSRLTSPQTVKALIAQLEPRGSTNLAGGLFCGIDEVRRTASVRGINRVFLFSDGLANHGMTSPYEIAGVVRQARANGISVSTLGLGLDYNEDLMQTIAEAGGGNYYYVESPSQMPAIFARELETLFATVAKDVRLHFALGRGVREAHALGYDTVATNGTLVVPIENLYAGETRALLLRILLDPRAPGRFDLGELRIDYTECDENVTEAVNYRLNVEATVDLAAVEASVIPEVRAEATLMSAEEEHERAVRDYERGEKELAKQSLADLRSRIETANAVLQDVRLDKKLEQLSMEAGDMDRADLDESDRQMYLKGSKNRLYNAQRGKRGQYLLQEAASGYEVEQLQAKLQELHLYTGAIDGVYSEEVRKAVETYQELNGLEPDGIAGPATLRSLRLY